MRGKITDQDLTDYALNELSPAERLYVESMLSVSEECRNDVYQMLEVSDMLREGFEAQENSAALLLNDEQRTKVLTVPRWQWRGLLQRVAAVALLLTGVGYAMKHPEFLYKGIVVRRATSASEAAGGIASDVSQKGFAKSAEEYIAARMQAAKSQDGVEFQFVVAPAVCTPPIFEMSVVPDVIEM